MKPQLINISNRSRVQVREVDVELLHNQHDFQNGDIDFPGIFSGLVIL